MEQNQWTLKESAVVLHEMYANFVEAGFTKAEALQLIIGILTSKEKK